MPTVNEHSGIIVVGNSGVDLVPGAWVLLMTATLNTTWSLFYMAPIIFPSGTDVYMDIGIGEAGSEVIIANDIFFGIGATFDYNDSYHELGLPLGFSIGDKISARLKDGASFGVNYEVDLRNFV